MVSRAQRHNYITPVLVNLHWLPVYKRVIFKTTVLVWKCLHGEAPSYLVDVCSGGFDRRSSTAWLSDSPTTRTSLSQRAFAVFGPWTWTIDKHNSNCSGTLATMTGAALAVTVSTASHINVTLSLLTLDIFIAPTPGRITTEQHLGPTCQLESDDRFSEAILAC